MERSIRLTPKEWKVYDFIRYYQSEKGYVPTVREIQEYMGFKSSSSAHGILAKMQCKGVIDRFEHCPRAYSIKTEGICQ